VPQGKPLYLCAGSQSSGSTLISWCFLQRSDMDGILDARFDMIPILPASISAPNVWCKFTIACFRFSEVRQFYVDAGWDVKSLLVVRDVRSVFNSLLNKAKYARNGITAEDPPIRLRLRRLKEDWKLFRDSNWPILRYEDLADRAEQPLRDACAGMGLAWDDAMVNWKKSPEQMADAKYGNATFLASRKDTLAATLDPKLAQIKTRHIPPADLEWMESEFADFNADLRYPAHVPSEARSPSPAIAAATFENTRRYERLHRRHWFGQMMGKFFSRGTPALAQREE
jgi:hypothetical protein